MFRSTQPKTLIAALCGLSAAACMATSQDAPTPTLAPVDAAEQLLAPWVSDDAPGVAVAVSWKDELVYARGAGMANLEHDIPLSPSSVFQVASVSKQVTAFATLLLVSDGLIELDEDVRTYVPDFPQTETIITVRHLLDHASGLRERNTLAAMAGWMPDDISTERQMRTLIKRQRGVNFPAGAETEYSNTGYAVLAEIVERVSGMSFPAFTKARLFDPLGMTQSQFPESRNTLIPERAASYYPTQTGFANVIAASETYGSTGL